MRNLPEDELELLLRDGLQAQFIPETSPDFDARVLAALRVTPPWWQRLWPHVWQPAQPLLAGASFSLVVTLIGLHWSLSAPVGSNFAPPLLGAGGPPVAARPAPSLDALLSRPNLTAGSLAAAWSEPPASLPPVDRPPEPRRHAQTFRPPALIA